MQHSSSTNESVKSAIKDYRDISIAFLNLATLDLTDYSLLLHILLSVSQLEPSDMHACDSYLEDHSDLMPRLDLAYQNGAFDELCDHVALLDGFHRTPDTVEAGGMPMTHLNNNSEVSKDPEEAFKICYVGDQSRLIEHVLDIYSCSESTPSGESYKRSVSIIQSSGMGKSRLVDEISEGGVNHCPSPGCGAPLFYGAW
ncbi:hypothetical protein RSOLAG22IIIB_08377 [Rhizoctonia solani]|uniref:Uncharacterized protein n=1 Tax=Rhizoctonia solani TaxID=456999 RepID=A0A0K6FTB4_9AGAM|nr:hypothetical protein RSOLAG22IIIB_08377 [Rhizoctonia solani]